MIAMDWGTGKVVVSRKTKQAYSESKGTRDHIIENVCIYINGLFFTTAHNWNISFWSLCKRRSWQSIVLSIRYWLHGLNIILCIYGLAIYSENQKYTWSKTFNFGWSWLPFGHKHPVKSHFSRLPQIPNLPHLDGKNQWIVVKQILQSSSWSHRNQCKLLFNQNWIQKVWSIPSG